MEQRQLFNEGDMGQGDRRTKCQERCKSRGVVVVFLFTQFLSVDQSSRSGSREANFPIVSAGMLHSFVGDITVGWAG